jgi:hypothetical protein
MTSADRKWCLTSPIMNFHAWYNLIRKVKSAARSGAPSVALKCSGALLCSIAMCAVASESHEFKTEAAKLKAIQDLVKTRKLQPVIESTVGSPYCERFLKDFVAGLRIQAIEPVARADSMDHPGLKRLRQCDGVDEVDEKRKLKEGETRFNGIDLIGQPPYRYYHLELDGNSKNGKEDVLFSYGGGSHSVNYTWVDVNNCVFRGGAGADGINTYRKAPPNMLRLTMLVAYLGESITLSVYPTFWDPKPVRYNFELYRFGDSKKPRICAWSDPK